MSSSGSVVVVGVGPGLGAALAGRFADGGLDVGLVARTQKNLDAAADAVNPQGRKICAVPADVGNPVEVARVFGVLRATLPPIEVLIYNAGAFVMKELAATSPEEFEASWRANCFGAFLAAREVLGGMLERKRGTVLFTGATASLRGGAKFAAFAAGKFGLRAVAQSLAREVGAEGIHVAHVVVDGIIDTPRTKAWTSGKRPDEVLSPDAIAELYWQLHNQQPAAWTHELDVRPAAERF